jgi:hypothetical protein
MSTTKKKKKLTNKPQTVNVDENAGIKEHFHTASGNAKYGNNYVGYSKN